MFPVLVTLDLPLLGTVVIHTYGVAAAAGFVVGLSTAQRRLGQAGVEPFHAYWAAVFLIPAFAIGGKLLPLAQNPFYRQQLAGLAEGPLGWAGVALVLALPGGSLLGAALAGGAGAMLYARFYDLPTGRCLDAVAPGAALAIPLMRVGCLGAGCCYGTPTSLPWGVSYGDPAVAAMTGVAVDVPVHPTPMYEALAVLVLAFVLARRDMARARPATIGVTFIGGYSLIRFFTEFVRGDSRAGPHVGPLTVTQVVASLILLASIVWIRRVGRGREPAQGRSEAARKPGSSARTGHRR